MAIYSANHPNRTLTLHKVQGCKAARKRRLQPCECGATGKLGNQQWWCEEHITRDQVNNFIGHRFWAILLCDDCFRGEE